MTGRVRRRDDRGVASIELLGIMPLALLLALIGLQVGAFLWAVTNTNEAARQGARAQSLGQDGCATFRATLADSLDTERTQCRATGRPGLLTGSPTEIEVAVKVPIIPFIDDFVPDPTIERTVYLP